LAVCYFQARRRKNVIQSAQQFIIGKDIDHVSVIALDDFQVGLQGGL
jgi:hypothetical protein